MKYIMMEAEVGGVTRLIPIMFPDFLCHIHVEESIRNLLSTEYKIESKIHSAGDIDMFVESCSGRSATLDVESGGDNDASVINRYDYFHGIVY